MCQCVSIWQWPHRHWVHSAGKKHCLNSLMGAWLRMAWVTLALGTSSPITLIAPFTSGTVQARYSGPFTSWHMKMLPVPKLLLDAIQPLCLTLFNPRVLLPVSMHGEHPSLVLHLRVVTSSLSKVISRTFSSPPMLKVGASFPSLVSRLPCVPGRLELFLIMLPLGSSNSAFSL